MAVWELTFPKRVLRAYKVFVAVETELTAVITVSPRLMEPVPVPMRSEFTWSEETDPWSDVKFWRVRVEMAALRDVNL
jgi:hypothetical protein